HCAPPTRRAPPGAALRPLAAGPPAHRPVARPSGAGSARVAAGSARPSRAVLYVLLYLYDSYVLYGPPSESEDGRPARVPALLRIPKTGARHSEEGLPRRLRIRGRHPPVDNLASSSHAAPCAAPAPAIGSAACAR